MQRARNKFGVAIAEVADNDAWQVATLGAACVSNDARHARQIIDALLASISDERLDAELTNVESDVIDMDG